MEINPQDIVDVLREQRNSAHDVIVQLIAEKKALERKIKELESDPDPE